MTPIPVIWLSYHEGIDARGPWDTGILERLFSGESWHHGIEFEHQLWGVPNDGDIGYGDVGIFVVPARHHVSADDVTRLNRDLAMFKGVILILVGDEEAQFPWRDIDHPNIRFWVQMPDPAHYGDMSGFAYFFGNGFKDNGDTPQMQKTIPWLFAGQNTNTRRKAAVIGLNRLDRRLKGEMHLSQGFSEGLSRDEYLNYTARSWIVVAPSGPRNVDTFRAYEALENGCIPIVDGETPAGPTEGMVGYWQMVYGEVPFPIVNDWTTVGGVIEQVYRDRYMMSARCQAWWQQQKRAMALRLRQDLTELGAHLPPPARMSAIVTTSPVLSNPSLDHINETVQSIRDVFGHPEILIACDGVRPEQAHLKDNYALYLYDLCRLACQSDAIVPYVADGWRHQARLTAEALVMLGAAPIILFAEHDTPLVTDCPIDVESALRVLEYGLLDVLRFHHEASILPDHEHLMIDHETTILDGLPVRRTVQWSQRPHLARLGYYLGILHSHFNHKSRTMIEDKMHSVVQSAVPGDHKIAIYHPGHENIKRSYHLDSRGSEPKFGMRY